MNLSKTITTEPDKISADHKIDINRRLDIIEKALQYLNDFYIFPDVAKKIETAIRLKVSRNEYDKIDGSLEFTKILTLHMREISNDKHLHIIHSNEKIPERKDNSKPSLDEEEKRREYLRIINYGFRQAVWLAGNIGYLAFDQFIPPEIAADTVTSMMNFITNTDALIIDLRNNGGGNPAMVALISSYFFAPEPVHLNDIYCRTDDSTKEWWTLSSINGHRYLNKDIYILTSKNTFSAAEEFTYNLKNLKRAKIIGERTGGGANPGGTHRIDDNFMIWIPDSRAINPITKTNWEGVGVEPDIELSKEQAFKTAYTLALKLNLEKTIDNKKVKLITDAIKNLENESFQANIF